MQYGLWWGIASAYLPVAGGHKMTTDLVNTVKALRRELDMTQAEFARLMGTSAVTVARWEENRSKPTSSNLRRLKMLQQMVDSLREVMKQDYIPIWLRTPHPTLGRYAPVDLLDEDFAFKEIHRLVESTKWGNFS
jgi:transcriptional regulator with XRE-family HTH domain